MSELAEHLRDPIGPEASLRDAIDEIVGYFGEPTEVYVSRPTMYLGNGAHMHQEIMVSNDSIVQADTGVVGAQILTQEQADPDMDEQLPHSVALRAIHNLGIMYAHITVPAYIDPLLKPSELQRSRPTIAVNVESRTRTTFDHRFVLNQLLGEVGERDVFFVEILSELTRSVRTRNGDTQDMTDRQMALLELYLTKLFCPGAQSERDRIERPIFRTLYQSLVAKFVQVRFGL